MTVKELINNLKDYDQDAVVVMPADAEGDSKSLLAGTFNAVYVPGLYSRGQAYVARTLTPELKDQGYTEEDCYDEEDGQDAVVLWPTN